MAYHNKSLILAHTSRQPSSSRAPAHCGYSSIHCQSLQFATYCEVTTAEERGCGECGVKLPFRIDRPPPATCQGRLPKTAKNDVIPVPRRRTGNNRPPSPMPPCLPHCFLVCAHDIQIRMRLRVEVTDINCPLSTRFWVGTFGFKTLSNIKG